MIMMVMVDIKELERTEEMYRGLVAHARRVLMGYFDLVRVCKGQSQREKYQLRQTNHFRTRR